MDPMETQAQGKYVSIDSDEDSFEQGGGFSQKLVRHAPLLSLCSALIHGSLLLCSITLFALASTRYHRGCNIDVTGADVSWSPILDFVQSQKTRFNETFLFPAKYPSKFARPQGNSVDSEWERFTAAPMLSGQEGSLALSKQDVERLGMAGERGWLDSVVQLEDGGEVKYMATLELSHYLHCLNMLRKSIHSDEYEDHDPHGMQGHLDHCIETIRESLMCNSGTGVVMFHWLEGQEEPYPDYNTYHQCRNADDILEWATKNAIPINHPLRRAPNAFALPGPPY